jgi:hypothetical protein
MSSTQIGLNSNFFNKSELIREVARAVPGATNKQVKKVIAEQYGVEVASNFNHCFAGEGAYQETSCPHKRQTDSVGAGVV